MNEPARQALTRARAVLILDQPFWGTLALRLELVEDETIPTAAVDGARMHYNPGFILALDNDVRRSVVAHEVGHCALAHIDRAQGREHGKFNRACDYALNPVLQEGGFTIPGDWLLDDRYRNMSAEQIYNLLPDPPPGGAAPGVGEPGGALDDLRPGAGADEAARLEAARDWQVAVAQAAMAAKGIGTLPASLARLVEDVVNPKLDWRLLLRRFVTERTKDDYRWTRPNRHMLVHGLYLPSLYSESIGLLIVAVDSSASTALVLAAFAAEIDDIVQTCRPRRVIVVYCDAAVAGVDEFEAGDPFTMTARGGGGTRFKPVFDYVEEHNLDPAALVYLTDLLGPTGFAAPPYPVLWCATTDRVGPWGETIRIDA